MLDWRGLRYRSDEQLAMLDVAEVNLACLPARVLP
jgi:hypothetical protein